MILIVIIGEAIVATFSWHHRFLEFRTNPRLVPKHLLFDFVLPCFLCLSNSLLFLLFLELLLAQTL